MRAPRDAVVLLVLLAVGTPAAAEEPTGAEPAPVAQIEEAPDYDPWHRFNEKTFDFNFRILDRYVMKPIAKAWDWLLPDPVQHSLERAFANLEMPRRCVNNLLQARPRDAGEEVGRFLVNTTAGVAGLFDVAGRIGLHAHDADTGQTFGVWGIGPGPYLVVPLMAPMTIRDGIGLAADGAMDPLGYVLAVPLAVSLATTAVRRVNERSLTPEAFEHVEETVIDLYSAVRNAYLQRRRRAVGEGRARSQLKCLHDEPVVQPASSPGPAPTP